MTLGGSRRVHFVGIGGAGMSAIAKILIQHGIPVSGSDIKSSRYARTLEELGVEVHVGHDARLVDEQCIVVVSSAIPASNPELRRARVLGNRVMTRGEALAALLHDSDAVVVAGTHGKTTTTSMITTVLLNAGLDPTYLIGGELNDSGTNASRGTGTWTVAESDESDGSFLLLSPTVAVVTNVELDHVDHWESLEELRAGFRAFMGRTAAAGAIVVPAADDAIVAAARASGRRVTTFGEGGRVKATGIAAVPRGTSFELTVDGAAAPVRLDVPGMHNVHNALAAAGGCLEAGLGLGSIARGLASYRGVERRFDVRGEAGGVTVIDDYAHHPSEVRATLAAARRGPWRRVVAVFQPHRYSRTAAFAGTFGAAFPDADRIVVTEVYGAGERPVPGVTGKLVSDAVGERLPGRPVAYLPHRGELMAYLDATVRPGDAVLTLGAGDVKSVGEELLQHLEARV